MRIENLKNPLPAARHKHYQPHNKTDHLAINFPFKVNDATIMERARNIDQRSIAQRTSHCPQHAYVVADTALIEQDWRLMPIRFVLRR